MQILQRDRLVSCLLEEISEKYASQVTVVYQTQCNSVSWGTTPEGKPVATLHCTTDAPEGREGSPEAFEITTEFLVGADGARSTVPRSMEEVPGSKFRLSLLFDRCGRVGMCLLAGPRLRPRMAMV